ncbi:class I SAM-dependent methyltransferase [Amycolatopsis thermophila]|uniref:hypothetical protein n=1 Tax=Amycolatopsis thermophila TaxID=206084 RepID=UPI0027D8E720|nr:hypothetical protein [Amycolatopsis thermophila]
MLRDGLTGGLYGEAERSTLPAEAVQASLGCGNPLALAELREGETVLDLGSGGGIDVLLSARRLGPTSKVYGAPHDRGDARAGTAQCHPSRCAQRQGPHRIDPAARRPRRLDHLPLHDQAGEFVGCIADVEITTTHQVAEGMHSAIVRARKPAGTRSDAA